MRPSHLLVLLLLLLPATAVARKAGDDETKFYTASTSGSVTIDTAGLVTAVDIDPRQLGDDVMDAVANQVRAWRFVPDARNGAPAPATYRMRLELVAADAPGDTGMGVAVRDVHFVNPDGAKVSGEVMWPPRYPEASLMAGVGGQVMLLIRLGADGSVADVGPLHVLLYGDVSPIASIRKIHIRRFVDESVAAAARWRFRGPPGELVRVPVQFNAPGTTPAKWSRTRVFALRRAPWIDEALLKAREKDVAVGGLDVAIDPHARLLTEQHDALMPGRDG